MVENVVEERGRRGCCGGECDGGERGRQRCVAVEDKVGEGGMWWRTWWRIEGESGS